ncbi:MAG: hypothetical protein AVDCRST_MAG68-5716 [uncultured Gemmatimonadetes bacterium]|uniref:Resolvase/invertase-type recombinase catalytic domain-containing protein n=1 Tax=uncultured Gemmatimonadota bacterium TaxID=203437 RepID=A0A6J4N1V8_9BACT|nr:MAG: hypothetical protein AVDCRST_MAG68-5716 [uncultured Gemmatimonadota bacterium]
MSRFQTQAHAHPVDRNFSKPPTSARYRTVSERGQRKLAETAQAAPLASYSGPPLWDGNDAHLDSRVRQALQSDRRVLVWIRHSDPRAAEESEGSRRDQYGQYRYLAPYGLTESSSCLDFICAAGETATEREAREFFERELMERLDSGNYGILLVNEADRISRNMRDGVRFVETCDRHRVLIVIRGRVLDPRNADDKHMLYALFVEASRESSRRSGRLMRNRCQKAAIGKLRNTLPSGLIHATPDDPLYRQRLTAMADALGDPAVLECVTPEQLVQHKVVSTHDGRPHYILPYPDAEMYTSVKLRLAWLRECGSLRAVLRRIEAGYEGWPPGRAGMIPMMFHTIFRHTNEVHWRRATLSRLRRWIGSPALYGTFSFHARRFEEQTGGAGSVQTHTVEVDAFPSFASADEYAEIRALLQKPKRKYREPLTDKYRGARNFAIPQISCCHDVPGRGACGMRMHAQYARNGEYCYWARQCGVSFDHHFMVSAAAEDFVIDALISALDPVRVRTAVDAVRLAGDTHRVSLSQLSRRRDAAENEARVATEFAVHARARLMSGVDEATGAKLDADEQAAARDEAEAYAALSRQKRKTVAELCREIERAQSQTRSVAELTGEDLAELATLAGDLRSLIAEARMVDREVDRMMKSCTAEQRHRLERYEGRVRAVLVAAGIRVFARQLDDGRVELTVEFPRGGRITGVLDCDYGLGSQVERLYIHHETRVMGRDPDVVAREIGRVHRRRAFGADPGWTAAHVRAAALMHEYADAADPPPDAVWPVESLANAVGVGVDEIMTAALRGRLGRGLIENGTLLLEAGEERLDNVFPNYGKRRVAAQTGWPLDEVRTIVEFAQERGILPQAAWGTAQAWETHARDASGRRYCWGPRTPISGEERLGETLARQPEHIRALDPSYWMRLHDAAREFGCISNTVKCSAISISYGKRGGSRPVYVWIDPVARAKLTRVDLADAVAVTFPESCAELAVEDFIPREDALSLLSARFRIGYKSYMKALHAADILEIRATDPARGGKMVQFVWLPKDVRESADSEVARAWLGGESLPASMRGRIGGDSPGAGIVAQ